MPAIDVGNITKEAHYDPNAGKLSAGKMMEMSENLGLAEIKYYGTAWLLINIIKGGQSLPRPGKPWGTGNRTSDAVHVGNGYYDTSADGINTQWNPLVQGTSLDPYFPQGTYILRWVGSCNCRWSAEDFSWASEDAPGQQNYLIAGQTHLDFNGAGDNGSFAVGSGHAVDDVITFVSGAKATVDAVDGSGGVTGFTIDKTGDYNDDHGGGVATGDDGTQVAATADNQSSSTGSGTGFNLTPGVNNIIHRIYYTTNTTLTTGGTTVRTNSGTCTRIELLQPGNEARYDQGNIVCNQTVSDLDGFTNLRFMGISQTNNSYFRHYSEFPQYEDALWQDSLPAKAVAKFCNECDADGWVNIPHMFTDAATTSYLQEINSHLKHKLKIFVENSNEASFNSAPAFKEGFSWIARADVDSQDAAIDLTTSRCSTPLKHNLTTGQEIICYFTVEHLGESFSPYNAGGGVTHVIVDDDYNFRLANSEDAALRRADVTATGDSEYSATNDTNHSDFANMTIVRYKPEGVSAKSSLQNYADESVRVWALGDAVLGRNRCVHVGMGQRSVPNTVGGYIADAAFREEVDHTGISCYYRWCDLSSARASMPLLTHVVDGQTEANYNNTDRVTDGQDETSYDTDPEVEGKIESDGGGHAATDVITMGLDFDVNTDADTVNTDTIPNDTVVRVVTDNTLPSPLVAATDYYIINNGTGTCQLSTSMGGSAINFTTAGTGNHAIYVPATPITVTVDAVDAGDVSEFTVDSSNDLNVNYEIDDLLRQVSSTGAGTAFVLRIRHYNITWNGTYSGGTGHAVDDEIKLGAVFTADVDNDRLIGLTDYVGRWKILRFESTGTLPAPLQPETDYFVLFLNTSLDYIEISDEGPYGTQITITDAGTGQHRIKGFIQATVTSVNGTVVDGFRIDSKQDWGYHTVGTTISQISSSGGGTNFSLTPGDSNIHSVATLDDCYDYLFATNDLEVTRQQQLCINASKVAFHINYEGFDHQGSATWSYKIRSIGDLIEAWGRSQQKQDWTAYWWKRISGTHCVLSCHHSFVTDIDYSGAWCRMEHQGDTDAVEQQAILPYIALGGVPKQ